jgi:streptogramin lyase
MTALKCVVFCLFTTVAYAQSSGNFELIANYQGRGGMVSSVVGPGPTPGSQRFYASVLYYEGTLDLLSIDHDTGKTQVFHSPLPLEEGAWGMTMGPDGNVYLGTCAHAHFFKHDPKQGTFVDLGRPSLTEQWIWDVAFGSDNRLYGVTSPNSKLVRYDPATGQLADLGRLDPTQQYARTIVASNDGFIYAGIGSAKANIAAYEIRTGKIEEILPPAAQAVAFANVYRGTDGNIYGAVGTNQFRLTQWTATALQPEHVVRPAPRNLLPDGRYFSLSNTHGTLTLAATNTNSHDTVSHEIAYQGKDIPLFRIGMGPDGALYGSSTLPSNLLRADLVKHRFEEVGNVGGGEVYSFLGHGERLLMAAYSTPSPLMSYRPGVPFLPAASSGNPTLAHFPGENASWRPEAMINGPGGKVYVSGIAGYGQLGSPLIEWDTESGSIQQNKEVVHDQCIVSLAIWHDRLVGGTSITGGPGSHPTQKEAILFVWNPKNHQNEFDVVPVAGATNITDLIAAPNGLVYGIAGDTLFAFNPATSKIVETLKLPFASPMAGPNPLYNSVSVDAAGRIWGLTQDGIFRIDTKSFKAQLIARSPHKITGGYAVRNGKIYFISASAVYSYTM